MVKKSAKNTGLPGIIFEAMQADIITGVYPVGTKLPPERDLSRKYGASRFAVREAIAMLAQGGLVETHPQSGTYVRDFNTDCSLDTLVKILRIRKTIDRDTLESLLRFRHFTETTAAAEAALRAGKSDIEYLERNLERKREHLADIPELTRCDFDFHYTVIALSGNIISRLVFKSFEPVYSFFTEFYYSLEGAPETSLRLNEKLVRALGRRNPDAARRAMGNILKFGEKRVFEAIKDVGGLIML